MIEIVEQLDDEGHVVQEFKSQSEVAAKLHISRWIVGEVLKGAKAATPHGFRFRGECASDHAAGAAEAPPPGCAACERGAHRAHTRGLAAPVGTNRKKAAAASASASTSTSASASASASSSSSSSSSAADPPVVLKPNKKEDQGAAQRHSVAAQVGRFLRGGVVVVVVVVVVVHCLGGGGVVVVVFVISAESSRG